ncbi:MAG: pyruvate ferredoxin oxidoreductase [Candidatus Brocadiaceae bacterium]|nr:pyruvate ferredoxin oxidoreductase [Candidatus Brocadiaceae bacterium]
MAERVALTGNDSAAYALKQINPDVVAAYPITPQTEMMHKFAAYVADGEVVTEFVPVESEHSAMSAAVGASLAGARACTATSANGLALMWEILYIAASCRCPIAMPVVNRALSGPINIHCDHSDTMGARDSGWIQIYSENCQEAYDNTIQAVRIAEHPDVRLPVMSCLDGFILSHTLESLEVSNDETVRGFLGTYRPADALLNVDNPQTFGAFALQNYYFEFKKQQIDAMANALTVIEEVGREYGKLTGRSYGLLDAYRCDDAEVVLVGLGSTMGTAKQAVDDLRAEGIRCGVLKVRSFRPFPFAKVREALAGAAVVGVVDRAVSFGLGGPLYHEVRSALYGGRTPTMNFIYGLGGRDLSLDDARGVLRSLTEAGDLAPAEPVVRYIGLRD